MKFNQWLCLFFFCLLGGSMQLFAQNSDASPPILPPGFLPSVDLASVKNFHQEKAALGKEKTPPPPTPKQAESSSNVPISSATLMQKEKDLLKEPNLASAPPPLNPKEKMDQMLKQERELLLGPAVVFPSNELSPDGRQLTFAPPISPLPIQLLGREKALLIDPVPVPPPAPKPAPAAPPRPASVAQVKQSRDTASNRRVIQVGDLIDVRMLHESDMNLQIRVGSDGTINLPYVGNVEVSGKTIFAAIELLEQKFSNFYREPVVSINIIQAAVRQFSILGQIQHPGVYEMPEMKDEVTFVEAIARAGGVARTVDSTKATELGQVTIKRTINGEEKAITFNGKTVIQTGKVKDYPVLPGDTLIVQLAQTEFYILGEVRSPGIYKLSSNKESMDLMEAIAMAGGLSKFSDLGKIIVKRFIDGEEQVLTFDGKSLGRNQKGANFNIYAGDTIIVQMFRNEFIILGQINRPGKYELPALQDSIDIMEAMAMAGGATRLANIGNIKIRRTVNGKETVLETSLNRLIDNKTGGAFRVLAGDRIIVSERLF